MAVLGSGPAGLMAAHAVALNGWPVAIFSQPPKSHMSGAQFLHAPIPMVNTDEPDTVITYRVNGDPEEYKKKVYGLDPNVVSVSMQFIKDGQEQPAWNLLQTYDKLWDLLSADRMNVQTVTPPWLQQTIDDGDFDMIISSVPAPALCKEQHAFPGAKVVLMDDTLEAIPNNTVVYDGTKDHSYYRTSRLFGVGGTEWAGGVELPIPNLKTGIKPLRHSCTCFPDVVRVGRFGKWTKGVLTHHAFEDAMVAMRKLRGLEA